MNMVFVCSAPQLLKKARFGRFHKIRAREGPFFFGTQKEQTMKTNAILLIDESEEFRSRLAASLEPRGFSVLQAMNMDGARDHMRTTSVSVAVVDGLLSGRDGLDLVAQLRSDYPDLQIVFVSHRISHLSAHERLAHSLGVALICYKPISAQELSLKICGLMEPAFWRDRPQPGEASKPAAGSWLGGARGPQLEAARREYEQSIPGNFQKIGQSLIDARHAGREWGELEQAHRIAHTLNGTAGSLGFSDVSAVAYAMENVLKEIVRMRRLTSSPPAWPSVGSDGPELEALESLWPGQTKADRERTVVADVLVVDDDPDFLATVAAMGKENLIRVYCAPSGAEALRIAQNHSLDMAIIDVYLLENDDAFDIARSLRSLDGLCELPIAFISADTSLENRIAAAHAGGSLFIKKPLSSADFAAVARRLAPLEIRDRARLLVVDDDPIFCTMVAGMLEGAGMQVQSLQDPKRILEVLTDYRPDLILLDVLMPDVSGFDVCRVMRSTEQWRDIPVIFLTAKTDKEILLQCFKAGGDDYLVKPTLREELLARINVRLERVRMFRERADRDALTGLPTRRPFIDMLRMRIEEGVRFDKPVSLCLIDLDHFKRVNDTYGHLSGDRVLSGFGHLLGSRFRSMDVRGRWGGEEFVVAFYGEDAQTARMIINRVLEEVREMTFTGDHGESFSITFSAGIASFPEAGRCFDEMFRRVDAKLYEAKEKGRNRIEV